MALRRDGRGHGRKGIKDRVTDKAIGTGLDMREYEAVV
jgi:hypothetical protein